MLTSHGKNQVEHHEALAASIPADSCVTDIRIRHFMQVLPTAVVYYNVLSFQSLCLLDMPILWSSMCSFGHTNQNNRGSKSAIIDCLVQSIHGAVKHNDSTKQSGVKGIAMHIGGECVTGWFSATKCELSTEERLNLLYTDRVTAENPSKTKSVWSGQAMLSNYVSRASLQNVYCCLRFQHQAASGYSPSQAQGRLACDMCIRLCIMLACLVCNCLVAALCKDTFVTTKV